MSIVTAYFQAFASKDISTLSTLLADDVTLQDPFVGLVSGKNQVLKIYRDFFESCHRVVFETKREYLRTSTSVAVEFSLGFDKSNGERVKIEGIDCIEQQEGKICGIRAYLDVGSAS